MTDTITLPRIVIEQTVKALAECYDVADEPNNGSTQQDAALNAIRYAIATQVEKIKVTVEEVK